MPPRPLRHRPLTTTRPITTTLAGLALAGLLAACSDGGSDDSAATTTTTTTAAAGTTAAATAPPTSDPFQQAAFDYAQCFRDNGIEDYPDPQVDGSRVEIASALDLNTHTNEEVAAAQEACQPILEAAEAADAGPEGSAPIGTASEGESEWEKIVPGGDCECADGSEFAFWERQADPTKVVLYLGDLGACTDAATCAFTGSDGESDFYTWNAEGADPNTNSGEGIWDFDNPDNPFADYSFIYVGSCTGDLGLGDATREYSPELSVEHNGFVNGSAALAYLAEHYPDATQVVVVGSVAAPVYGGLVADLLPDTQVTVFADEVGSLPDDPDFNAEILGQWGAYDNMPDWEVNEGLTAHDWGPRRFWIQAGLHNPDIVMARFDYAFDPNAARTLKELGVDDSTLELLDANEAAIEAAGVDLHSYTAGDGHAILDRDGFYELEVNGVKLVDWIEALLAGEPLDDVRCDDCEAS